MAGKSHKTILALGDSYTVGEGVPPNKCWPMQLAEMLQAQGLPMALPEIVACTGWTTDELLAGLDGADVGGKFDLVSVLIGVNNQYRGRPVDDYRNDFRQILGRALAFAGGKAGRVLVLSIPDWGVTPFAAGQDRKRIAAEIDSFNQANRLEAGILGAAYLDVTRLSRWAADEPEWLAPDGLHPSAEMYTQWARLVLPAALQAFQES